MTAHGGLVLLRARFIALLAAGMAALSAIAMTGTAAGDASTTATGAAAAVQSPIKHIVVLYLENHSFDDLRGYWCRGNPGR